MVSALFGTVRPSSAMDTSDLERKIVDLYSDQKCIQVNALMAQIKIQELRPNIIAVIASCEPSAQKSESLFKLAEERDPHGDLIAMLHALRLSQTDQEAAKPQWTRVLMYARSNSMRDMAREALSGLEVRQTPLNLSSWTWTVQADAGASHHSSPWYPDLPGRLSAPSNAIDTDLFLRAQHWIRRGSISATYRLEDHRFLRASSLSTQSHLVELPFALRVGESEDLIFRPFFEQSQVGGEVFSNTIGMGFVGVAYRQMSKQTVSGFAASEQTVIPDVQSPRLAHYHFNYQWEWFPPRWLLLMNFSVDNFSANRIQKFGNVPGDFNESHNDLSFCFTGRRGFDRISFGLTSLVKARFDAHDSQYIQPVTLNSATKMRNDFTLELEPHFIWRIRSELELRAYAKFSKVVSTISAGDYGVNRSHEDVALGLLLRTYWSSY